MSIKTRTPASPPEWLRTAVTATRGDRVTVTQLAAALGVHAWTVRRWIRAGRIEAPKVGTRLRISRAAVERFLATEAGTSTERTAVPA
jgi:excisionase family DNA binding protein